MKLCFAVFYCINLEEKLAAGIIFLNKKFRTLFEYVYLFIFIAAVIVVVVELTHSKTILENTNEIKPQPVALDFKNLSQYCSCSK